MKYDLPKWALRDAEFEDSDILFDQLNRGTLRLIYPERKVLKNWARARGWVMPWFGFEKAFIRKILEKRADFHSAIAECGIEILMPKSEFTIDNDKIAEFDSTYANPNDRCYLIEDLREIRRAVEAGIVIRVGDLVITTWQQFYSWAHGRYHFLEEGCDKWIGDDS